METVRGVHHLAIVVSDLAGAEAFYAGVLGLPVIQRWTDDEGAPRSVWLSLGEGDAFVAVERVTVGSPGEPRVTDAPGWHCVALRIDADRREPWRARLLAAGFPVERETAYTLYTRDPEGNLVAFSHYPEAASPGP